MTEMERCTMQSSGEPRWTLRGLGQDGSETIIRLSLSHIGEETHFAIAISNDELLVLHRLISKYLADQKIHSGAEP